MKQTIIDAREFLEREHWRSAIFVDRLTAQASCKHLKDLTVEKDKISVITVCFNAERHIDTAIKCIEWQTYPNIEYIVIDGASSDGTIEKVRSAAVCNLAVSMTDEGIADAFNRGVALATGEFIAFLNADDIWPPDHVERSLDVLKSAKAGFVFGDLMRFDEETGRTYILRGDPSFNKKLDGWPPEFNHPTFITKRSVFEVTGLFCKRFKICMDFEWLKRVSSAGIAGIKANTWVIMRCGGVSDQSRKTTDEILAVLSQHGIDRVTLKKLKVAADLKFYVKRALNALRLTTVVDKYRKRFNPSYASGVNVGAHKSITDLVDACGAMMNE